MTRTRPGKPTVEQRANCRAIDVGDVFDAHQQQSLSAAIGRADRAVLVELAHLVADCRIEAEAPAPDYRAVEDRFAALIEALRACAGAAAGVKGEDAYVARCADAFGGEDWQETERATLDRLTHTPMDDWNQGWLTAVTDAAIACDNRTVQWFENLSMQLRAAELTIERGRRRIRRYRVVEIGRPGPKGATARRGLATEASMILERAGVPLRKSADSDFAKALTVLYEAAGLALPEDIFRDVSWALEALPFYRKFP